MATEKQLAALRKARRVKAAKHSQATGLIDSIKSAASRAHQFVKDKKLISSGLDILGYKNASNFAKSQGYGKKKKKKGTGARTKLELGLIP